MRRLPTVTAVLLCAAGMGALALAGPRLPDLRLGPAALGATSALVVTAALLGGLRGRDRMILAGIAGGLGFFTGLAASSGLFPWPLGFGGAWAPMLMLLLAEVGEDRVGAELARLETEADDPAARPEALRRAEEIRERALGEGRALEEKGARPPASESDPRVLAACAAQVVAYALSKDRRHQDAADALAEIPPAWMPPDRRPVMLSNLSFLRLCAGDVEAAQQALAGANGRGAPAVAQDVLRAARAAVLVRAGQLEEALDLVGREDRDRGEPPFIRQRNRITRAHALVALGEVEAAQEELRKVLEDGGEEELRRAIPAGGPALKYVEEIAA